MSASVGVGLWCRVCCCVCLRACVGLEYKMQSAAQFQQVEDIFIMTNISYSFFFAADAALRRCAADAAAAASFCLCL